MYYQVISGIVLGVEGSLVRVEVDASNGMPYFSMVGYLSSEVKEAKDRVISALRSVSFPLPPKRITVNLSPADIRKAGSSFDFPIAVAILGSFELFPIQQLKDAFLAGEMSLEEVARVFGYSPTYLSRMFQKYAGITFKSYLQNIRLGYAVKDLDSGKYNITETALRNGFSGSKALARAFRKRYGVLPSEYREQYHKNGQANQEE